jgi:hypothetical protein
MYIWLQVEKANLCLLFILELLVHIHILDVKRTNHPIFDFFHQIFFLNFISFVARKFFEVNRLK